jgi:hypothetical protein
LIANDPKHTPGPTSLNWLVIQAKVKIKRKKKNERGKNGQKGKQKDQV